MKFPPTHFVFASANKNKLSEVRAVASEYGYTLLSPTDISDMYKLPPYPDPEESGSTYHENAYIKAQACFDWCKLPSIGDDSGLEIEILNNAPGIYSARYAGIDASDNEKIEKVLEEVKNAKKIKKTENSNALFRCVLCLVDGKNDPSYFEGSLQGSVLPAPRGERGFGYDPIIHIAELNRTLSEISFEELIRSGFRGKALRTLIKSITPSI